MIPEFGHFALILVLCLSMALAVLPMLGSFVGNDTLMRSGRTIAPGVFIFSVLAFGALTWSFVQNDFSVAYIARTSNLELPIYYKLCAVWGGHEGSLLLWILMQAGWLFAVSIFARSLTVTMHARVLSVMGLTMVGILWFTLMTSNPFERLLPGAPSQGSELNPLLQHFGFIMHPPILYMGYSGLAVAFSFAIAALISGHLDSAWARWSRPWTNVAWAFLTLGIGLGSWWAYYELGWGFWWGWDPTENNSLFPWLIATALMHSLIVTEKRGLFKAWTVFLAVFAFSMALMSTFVIRSGIISSVHAFANDPERGAFLLAYVLFVIVASLILYAFRAPNIASISLFRISARESFVLLNNIVLVVLMILIMFATFFPVLSKEFGWGTMSVGAPFFNIVWVSITVPLCLVLGASALTQWKNTPVKLFKKYLSWPLLMSFVAAVTLPFLLSEQYKIGGAVTTFVGVWVITGTLSALLRQTRNAPSLWQGLRKQSTSYYSMVVGHLGIGIVVLGAGFASVYSTQRNVALVPGEEMELFGYSWRFEGVRNSEGPNFLTRIGTVTISKGNKVVAELSPEKRVYLNGQPTTEAGVKTTLLRDLYVSLGEPTEPLATGGWIISIYIKAFMLWLWAGIIITALGGFMALVDKRYRLAKEVKRVKQTLTDSVTV